MAALNDGEGAPRLVRSERTERATPDSAEPGTEHHTRKRFPAGLHSRQLIAAVTAIGGIQLMVAMDGPIAVFALPKIQSELGLSDAGRNWVITAYLLTFGGLMLLGGRLGDTFGRKRTFIAAVAVFTVASTMCGLAWNESTLVSARLLQGMAGAVIAPTCLALIATIFPKGSVRNAATAVFGAMAGVGAVLGLVAGGALAEVSWRLAFLVNVPIGLLVVYLAAAALRETQKERMKLDVFGAVLATLFCTAAVFGSSLGPEQGWLSVTTIGWGVAALAAFVAFIVVERTAVNPIVPFSLFFDRNRLATFAAMFLTGGVVFTLTVLVALYVQNIMGYSSLRAGVCFIPYAIAMGIGVGASSQLVNWFSPRVLVTAGAILMLGAMLYGSTLDRDSPYFPNLMVPIVAGGIAFGLLNVPLTLAVIASVDSDRIGPTSAVAVMLMNLGGPVVLVIIQAVITVRTLYLGGTIGPVESLNTLQLDALDQGFTYGLLWMAGVVILIGAAAMFIGYTARQVGEAQETKKSLETEGR